MPVGMYGTVITDADVAAGSPPEGAAPANAHIVTTRSETGLSAEVNLGALTDGILKQTVAGGEATPTIAAEGTDYYAPGGTDVAVADGGTGASTAADARTNLGIGSAALVAEGDLIHADGSVAFAADQPMGSNKLTGLADPTAAQDAATKAYVDGVAAGLIVKDSVRAASTGNLTLSGAQTIDGVSVIATNRVLVKNQTAPEENGIYVAAAGAWSRAADMDAGAEAVSAFTFVEEGTTQATTGWVQTTPGPITLDTTELHFAQFSKAGDFSAGNGLALAGTVFSVNVDGTTLVIVADTLQVKDAGIDTAQLANTAVTPGTYGSGSLIPVVTVDAKGRVTGVTTAAVSVSGAPASAHYVTTRAEAGLVNERNIGALSAGILYTTPTAGEASLSTAIEGTHYYMPTGTDVAVADGGTGASTAKAARANLLFAEGADIASGNNLAPGADGLVFHVTGTTQINLIAATNFNSGDVIFLIFDGACLVKHNQTASGANKPILLFGAVDVTTAAGDVLALVYDGTNWSDLRRGLKGIVYSQLQNVSATDKVLGRATAGAGSVEEIACTAFARSILDDADEATFKATVNLEIGTDVASQTDSRFSGSTINNQTDSYTLVASDAGKTIVCNKGTAMTITIPAEASVNYAIGTIINILQIGAGQVTVAITTDTLNGANGLKCAKQYSMVSIQKYASTVWVLTGDASA